MMITEEEILAHLANTVYSKGARKSIIGYLAGAGYNHADVTFAERTCSAQEERAHTFDDFLAYIKYGKYADELDSYCDAFNDFVNDFGGAPILAFNNSYDDNFKIGDWVKYIPTPDESYTECIEALAHDSDGKLYLCLSNGEYVRPSLCIKYKYQGDERRALIDKLDATL